MAFGLGCHAIAAGDLANLNATFVAGIFGNDSIDDPSQNGLDVAIALAGCPLGLGFWIDGSAFNWCRLFEFGLLGLSGFCLTGFGLTGFSIYEWCVTGSFLADALFGLIACALLGLMLRLVRTPQPHPSEVAQ